MNSEHQFILFLGIFVAFIALIGTLGFDTGGAAAPEKTNPLETSACNNIGGFDAVGDVLGCVSDTLGGYASLANIETSNQYVNILLAPLSLALGWLIVKRIRGG